MSRVTAATLVPRLLLQGRPDDRIVRVEGTALLIDISGFTVLSERLAATGREGTESLIATLSRIFTVLMSATDDGGDVLKFAGDALLVVYTGEGHARRAAHSAWAMQRVLGAVGDIRLPAARTRLRMSGGIHSGRFDVLLTGAATRSAVVAGADTWRVLALQSAAPAGRILVSAETARMLPQRLVAPEPDDAFRLLGGGTVVTDSLMALNAVDRLPAERFLPRAFAVRPDLLDSDPDHRRAAMGFLAVDDVPAVIDDDAADRIDALTRTVEAAVAATGATLLDIDPSPGGFRYFLTAGAPRTVEDPEGALIAALHSIVDAPAPLPVRAGLASGRVFAGFVGTPTRQTYTTMGDATNLAARLTSRAAPGTLLVAQDAAARARVRVELRALDSVVVKGKGAPIPVGVVDEVGTRNAEDAASVPFFGREVEVAAVESADAIVVSGAPGIGKSALVTHALAGVAAVRVTGDRYAARTAYGTLRQLLRPLLGIPQHAPGVAAGRLLHAALRRAAPDLVPWEALVADMLGAVVTPSPAVRALDDEFRAERSRAVLAELLPLVLPEGAAVIVEDAQWVDAASSASFTVALPAEGHRLVVVRREGEEGVTAAGRSLDLAGLEDEPAAELVETVVGHALLPSDLGAILARAAGNPLYLIELATATRSRDEPQALEQLIGEGIDALSEDDRHLVREAAVLGTRVPLALFERCVGPATALPAGFLSVHDDTVVFRSDLFREVAYEQLNFQQRRRLHRAAAEAIEADPALAGGAADAMLAVHFEAVGDWTAASGAARRSAEAAERAYALEDAVRAYQAAATAARRAHADTATLRTLWESLGRACIGCGRNADAMPAYDEARKLATDAVTRARLDRQRAYALNLVGRPADATAALRRARRNARAAGAPGLEATILVTEGSMRLRQGRWRDLRRLSIEAIRLLEGDSPDGEEKTALADAYRYHDIAASELEGDAAMIHLQQALELYDELGDAKSKSKVLNLIGVRAYHRGAWSTAAGLYAQAQDAAEAAGDAVGAAIESANAAEILIDQGRVDAARPLLRRARRVFAAVDDAYLVAFATAFDARADLRSGDPESAAEGLAAAATEFDELGEVDSVVDARVRRLEALLAAGEREAARAGIIELAARTDVEGVSLSRLRRHAARLAELDGDPARAAELLTTATDAAGAALYERALCLGALARLAGPEGALRRAEAESMLRELGVADIPLLLGDAAPASGAPARALPASTAPPTSPSTAPEREDAP